MSTIVAISTATRKRRNWNCKNEWGKDVPNLRKNISTKT